MNISTIIELEYQVELEIPNRILLPLLDNLQYSFDCQGDKLKK